MGGITTRFQRVTPVAGKSGATGKAGKAGAAGAAGASGAFSYTDLELPDASTISPDCAYPLNWTENTGSGGLTVDNPVSTPLGNGHKLTLRIKSADVLTFTWDSDYRGSTDTPLPTSTVGSDKTERWGFEWNAQDAKWDLVAYNRGH